MCLETTLAQAVAFLTPYAIYNELKMVLNNGIFKF